MIDMDTLDDIHILELKEAFDEFDKVNKYLQNEIITQMLVLRMEVVTSRQASCFS